MDVHKKYDFKFLLTYLETPILILPLATNDTFDEFGREWQRRISKGMVEILIAIDMDMVSIAI